jgi:hypothetical protein
MEHFLILGLPLIVVALAVIGIFVWGAKGSVSPKQQFPEK